MQGWASVDTARCERCGVYTPTTDLVFSKAGRVFCTTCGAPREEDDVVEWVPHTRTRLEHHSRVAALVMLAVTVCFPLAACVSSQL